MVLHPTNIVGFECVDEVTFSSVVKVSLDDEVLIF
jgi:hypothetical protein